MKGASGMKATPQQVEAVQIGDKNLIVVAGAGSGKTRVLVERYLQLLADNPGWRLRSLVAITFTRAAAFEMRQRVRLELERRAETTGDAAWMRRLSQMDTARIDTIHGLCAEALRANAAEAGIDPKFEVIDETQAAMLLENVIDDLLMDLPRDVQTLFAEYDKDKIMAVLQSAEVIESDLPASPPQSDELLESWRREWAEDAMKARDRLLAHSDIAALLNGDDYPAGDKLGALFLRYSEFLRLIADESDAESLLDLLRECHQNGRVGNVGSVRVWGSKEAMKAAGDQLRRARDLMKAHVDEIGDSPGDLDEKSARLLPLWIRLLRALQCEYRSRKMDEALLDFGDLERLTAQLLEHESVRQRYRGGEINHLLVDEFQDTNAAQWRIVQSLADLGRGGSLFVVGDPKQSIYQFRGADVSVFNRVREQIAQGGAGRALQLSTSFRAHRRLLSQFNALFSQILVRDPHSPVADYEVEFEAPMAAFRDEAPPQAPIELILLDKNEKDESGAYKINPDNGRKITIPAHQLRRWEALEIGRRARQMIESQRLVYDREVDGLRPMQYRDIAILFQSMSNISLYEDRFKWLGIPFITVAGRGYYERQEIWDMLDLLRCLHNPTDDLSLASALRSPMFGFSDDLFLALRQPHDQCDPSNPLPLWHALELACEAALPGIEASDLPLLRFARATLRQLRQLSGRVTISELLRAALLKTGYLAVLSALPDGARRRGNVEKLLRIASDSRQTTLGKFTRYLDDLAGREVREGEALIEAGNAIRLMTAHASKGLEFPLVVLADASWTLSGGRDATLLRDAQHGLSSQVFDEAEYKYAGGFAHRRNLNLRKRREAAERKRLLYVAATRAQDCLIISGQCRFAKDGWAAGGWLGELLKAFEMTDMAAEPAQRVAFAGDQIQVFMPTLLPSGDELYGAFDDVSRDAAHAPDTAIEPPLDLSLMDAVERARDGDLRHFAATQLAETVAAPSQRSREIREDEGQPVDQRALGAIAHHLLRYDRLDADAEMIASLAWQHGISSAHFTGRIVDAVQTLLRQYLKSDVYHEVMSARAAGHPCYVEMPFILRRASAVIHGVIDLLIQREDGSWMLVDFKTTRFRAKDRAHVTQVAVYAAAVQSELGLAQLPDARLHYLVDSRSARPSEADCLAALDWVDSHLSKEAANDA